MLPARLVSPRSERAGERVSVSTQVGARRFARREASTRDPLLPWSMRPTPRATRREGERIVATGPGYDYE